MLIPESEIKNQKLKTLLLTGVAFFFLFSCQYKKPVPPPPGLIDEAKMSKVICDITLSEASLNNEPLAAFNDTLKKVNVLKEYNITSQQFLLSMKYYSENPQKLKDIYTRAQEILSKKAEVKRDSIPKK
jgi:hypothetical protein